MKYKVLFFPEKSKDSEFGLLRMRVRWLSSVVTINVGYSITIAKWDSSFQRCMRNSSHGRDRVSASVINSRIQEYEDAVADVMTILGVDGSVPSKEQVRDALRQRFRPDSEKVIVRSLLGDFDEFVAEEGNSHGWSLATYKKMATLRKHIESWAGANVGYSDFNHSGMNSFLSWLLEHDILNRTAKKYIDTLLWFIRWADRRGLSGGVCDSDFKVHLKEVKKRVIFLSWDELMRMFNYKFGDGEAYLEHARDRFCFGCFTGLRYSDISSLVKTDITDTSLFKVTIKDVDPVNVELNKYSRALVDKYMSSPGDTLFPRMSSQRVNEYIKIVGKMCGIDSVVVESFYKGSQRIEVQKKKYELLTTHCGRRTFVVNALSLGIPADIVMKWTGHSDYKAMRPYIDIADDAKKLAMALFDEKKP